MLQANYGFESWERICGVLAHARVRDYMCVHASMYACVRSTSVLVRVRTSVASPADVTQCHATPLLTDTPVPSATTPVRDCVLSEVHGFERVCSAVGRARFPAISPEC